MRALTIAFCLLAATTPARAQEFYNFTSGDSPGDGFTWPATVDHDDCFDLFEDGGQSEFCNFTNNTVMIGIPGPSTATANASRINGEALWGNPRTGFTFLPDFFIAFDEFFFEEDDELVEQVLFVSFDLAWATSDSFASIRTATITVEDFDGDFIRFNAPLDELFSFGAGGSETGREGRVTIDQSLLDPDDEIDNIYSIAIELNRIATSTMADAEFAIDNMLVSPDGTNNGLSEILSVNSSGAVVGNYSSNVLKGQGIHSSFQGVKNVGTQPTTYTVTWTGSDPAIADPNPAAGVNVPIDPGEVVFPAAGWSIDTDTTLSGTFSGNFLIQNSDTTNDPDDTISLLAFRLHDPPVLFDNTTETINPAAIDEVTISNAPNLAHAGAVRASVKVTAASFTDSRFTLAGISVDDRVDAGATLSGTVLFDDAGVPPGTYTAQLRIELEMTGSVFNFLNRKQPVPDRVWNVQFTVAAPNQPMVNVTTGQNFGTSGLNINNGTTGLTLLDGISGSDQTVTASFDPNPPAAGGVKFINEAFDLEFSVAATQYVIQINYQDASVPLGFLEEELRIYSYNSGLPGWEEAIQLNSDGGTSPAGAAPFIGSYAEYLSTLGGGSLGASDLSAFGIDPENNNAWLVLDREGKFRLGTIEFGTLPPELISIEPDPSNNTNIITYQSFCDEVFGVFVSDDLTNYDPLPDTPIGDDTIKTYIHNLPAGSPRFFYQLRRN